MEINIQKRVLEQNKTEADLTRTFFKEKNVFVLNMMSSRDQARPKPCVKPWDI